MKLSASLPEEDVAFLDEYVRESGIGSRSAALHRAVGMLRASLLGDAYADAWQEWEDSGEAQMWAAVTGDGIVG